MKGWECPKCGRVWSPATDQCDICNGAVNTKECAQKAFDEAKLKETYAQHMSPNLVGSPNAYANRCLYCGRSKYDLPMLGCPEGNHYTVHLKGQ